MPTEVGRSGKAVGLESGGVEIRQGKKWPGAVRESETGVDR